MIRDRNIYSRKFITGNLNQWKLYKKGDTLIWLAGDNLDEKYNYLIKNIPSNKDINKSIIKTIILNIEDHFGLVYISKNLTFAAVDCARTYPIFW